MRLCGRFYSRCIYRVLRENPRHLARCDYFFLIRRSLRDNGSEFSSQAMDLWAYQNKVRMAFSRPGKPTDNAFVESFNGTFRAECLNAHWFTSLTEAQQIVETWRVEYNESRPHRSLGEKTPNEFAKGIAASRDSLELQTAENSP
jgi:putative transposase